MSTCPKCGNALAEGAVFCANCGSSIAAAPEAPAYAAPAYAAPEAPAYADPCTPPVEEKPAKAKKPVNIKLIAIIVAAALVVGGVVAWLLIANPFADPTTPLKDYIAYQNNEELSLSDERDMFAGLADDSVKKIYNIFEQTKLFESAEESWENKVDGYEESYGDDYEFSYKVVEKYKAPEAYVMSMEAQFFDMGTSLKAKVRTVTEDDIEEIAEYLDIEEEDVEDLLDALKKLGDALIKANVTEVYEIEYEYIIEGEEVEEDEDDEPDYRTFTVYKINGKFISSNAISMLQNRINSMMANN